MAYQQAVLYVWWIIVWRPRFSARLINPKDPIISVDLGQTTVNLSHHLENITNDP
jgi:hypothetical protein